MVRFAFTVIWTLLVVGLALATFGEADSVTRAFLSAFALFGILGIYLSWPHARRERSLRKEKDGEVELFVWIELDGNERRSTTDPRPEWDADGDGDGDGGGD
ncbi:MAG: hypothetical protein AAF865_10935 [Pseudomonadota bacterium]